MKKDPKRYCKNLSYKNDILHIEGINFIDLVKKYGSPLYCYSVNELKQNYEKFLKAVIKLNPLILFAMKSNYNPNLLKILCKLGAGFDVVSIGEIEMALSVGVNPKKIVFSGVGKTKEEIKFAIKKKILQINVESVEELVETQEIAKKLKKKIEVSIRVNPDVDAETHEKISTGRQDDKFGVSVNDIKSNFKKFKNDKNIILNGLAIHIGSQITSIEPFLKAFKKLREIVISLRRDGHLISRIDLGGGIGINYAENDIINLNEYYKIIKIFFNDLNLKIIFEPGRLIIGSAGLLVTKVIRVKKSEQKKFVIIDCGMNDLIRPSLYDSYHEIFKCIKENKGRKYEYDIVGPICESSDIFGSNRKFNKINSEELLIICSVGAYGSCMSSYYNCRTPAKELIIDKKNVFDSKLMIKLNKLYKTNNYD